MSDLKLRDPDQFGAPLSDEERAFMSTVRQQRKADAREKAKSERTDVLKRGDDIELATRLLAELQKDGEVVFSEDRFWQCRGNLWHALHDDDVSKIIQSYVDLPVTVYRDGMITGTRPLCIDHSKRKGILNELKIMSSDRDFFIMAQPGAPFANGLFIYVDRKTKPRMTVTHAQQHSSYRIRATQLLDYDLPFNSSGDPLPDPVVFEQYLDAAFAGAEDLYDIKSALYTVIGLARLQVLPKFKTHMILVGPANAGKSVLVDLMSSFFSPKAVATVTLHNMSHEYHRARLAGCEINSVSELPATEVLDSEPAKAILSGDTVAARHPGGRVFDLKTSMANVLACNSLPPSKDDALLERFMVFEFKNVLPPSAQDKQLGEKLRDERGLIMAKALWHAEMAIARNEIERPQSSLRAKQEWKDMSDPVASWLRDCVDTSMPDEVTGAQELYQSYRGWCTLNGNSPLASTRFGQRLSHYNIQRHKASRIMYRCKLLTPATQAANSRWKGATWSE